MRYKCVQWIVVCGVFVCLSASLAFAHGVVGKRKFIEPFVAEDANPKDEFVLAKPGHFNLNEETETEFFYDFVLMYDLEYLHDYVMDVGLPWPVNRLLPVVEFNFETVVNGPERATEAFITPGLVYRGDKYVQLGVAGQFPLNSTTKREFDSGIVFLIDLFYDDIIPAFSWTPF